MLILWGLTKKQYICGEWPKKGGLGQFSGGLVKNREDVFEAGSVLITRCALT